MLHTATCHAPWNTCPGFLWVDSSHGPWSIGVPERSQRAPDRGQTGAERAENGPRPRPGDLGPAPPRFVAKLGRRARSYGTTAPRCAPSAARLGMFWAVLGAIRQAWRSKPKNGRISG